MVCKFRSVFRLIDLTSRRLRLFFFSSRRRHTRSKHDWSSDVCSSDLTHSKSSGRIDWRVTEVVQPRKAVLEFPAPGFVAKFAWTFEDVSGRTRITQRVSLSGE